MRTLLGITLVLFSLHAYSASWRCHNNELEIQCSAGKCESSSEFTPFDVTINSNGLLSVCAYSGCWEGKGRVMTNGKHLIVSASRLRWTGANSDTAAFIAVVDSSDNVGFVKGEGFAMPLNCSPVKIKE